MTCRQVCGRIIREELLGVEVYVGTDRVQDGASGEGMSCREERSLSSGEESVALYFGPLEGLRADYRRPGGRVQLSK